MTMDLQEFTHAEWMAEGKRLFGDNVMDWAFVCPSCKRVTTTRQYQEAGAKVEAVGFSCIGRYLPECNDAFTGAAPCNYTSGGLICISPVLVHFGDKDVRCFAFAALSAGEKEETK